MLLYILIRRLLIDSFCYFCWNVQVCFGFWNTTILTNIVCCTRKLLLFVTRLMGFLWEQSCYCNEPFFFLRFPVFKRYYGRATTGIRKFGCRPFDHAQGMLFCANSCGYLVSQAFWSISLSSSLLVWWTSRIYGPFLSFQP